MAFNKVGGCLLASQLSKPDSVVTLCHDLEAPLTSIQGYALSILNGAADGQSAAQVIYDEAGKLMRNVAPKLALQEQWMQAAVHLVCPRHLRAIP